jgi:hypothetical protein
LVPSSQYTDITKSNNLLDNDIIFIDCFHKSLTARKWKGDLIWRLCEYLNVESYFYEVNKQDSTMQVNLLVSSTCLGDVFAHHQEHLTIFTV